MASGTYAHHFTLSTFYYSLIPKLIKFTFFLKRPHTTPHNDNRKRFFFLDFCKFIKNTNLEITCTQVFTAFSMKLKIKLRFILLPLNIVEMFLQLTWSPPVVNSLDWKWSGKAQAWLRSHRRRIRQSINQA